jgi:hypothetical protein
MTAAMIEPTEAEFQAGVIQYAELQGFRVAHFADSRREVAGQLVGDRQATGFPDLTMVRSYELVFAELKTAKGRLTPEQRKWLQDLDVLASRSDGLVRVYVWRPADWPEIERALRRI